MFVLRGPANSLALVSRSARPCDTRPWLDDRRHLGVRICRIALKGRAGQLDIPLDHPALSKGWWAVEPTASRGGRWTDGAAALPLTVPAGPWTLEVTVEAAMHYPLAAARKEPTGRAA